jgi:methyl-accepting chemotaxis protein/methyl-accepting chemotaxis protein-1 (serine sensor receptor)
MTKTKFTLGAKIYAGEGLTVGFLLILGIFAVITVTSLQSKMDRLVKTEARNIELAGEINQAVTMIQNAQRGLLLGSMINDTAMVSSANEHLAGATRKVSSALKEAEGTAQTGAARQTLAKLRSMDSELSQKTPTFAAQIRGQQFDVASKMQTEYFTPQLDTMERASAELVTMSQAKMAASAEESASQVGLARLIVLLLCLLSAAVAAAAFLVTRNAVRQMRRIAQEISEGSNQVASASRQVCGSSQSLAQGSAQQAASLEETAASAEEIHSMTKRNTDNARNASDETGKADLLLNETGEKLKGMIASMMEINTSSEKIGKIIRVIDEIAFQTNILALNAAVEAARAGEAGMGFAVVADEVRSLSQRCAQAAKDTSDLIEESIERSNEGKHRLDEVSACIGKVFENSARIKLLTSEVHLGSQEQSRGIDQISRAVAQMQQLTQSTAASAEQGAAAGQEMSAQAQALQDSVGRMRELVGNDGTGSQESRYSARTRLAHAGSVGDGLRGAPRAVAGKAAPVRGSATAAETSKVSLPIASSAAPGVGRGLGRMQAGHPAATQTPPENVNFPMDDDFKDF